MRRQISVHEVYVSYWYYNSNFYASLIEDILLVRCKMVNTK